MHAFVVFGLYSSIHCIMVNVALTPVLNYIYVIRSCNFVIQLTDALRVKNCVIIIML